MRSALTICLTSLLAASSTIGYGHPDHDHPRPVASSTTPVPATGALEYKVVPGWCQLPSERSLGNTHGGIVVDRNGNVYYNTDTDRSIMVHTSHGTFIRTMASDFPAIHGMVIRSEPSASGEMQQFIYAAHLRGKQAVKMNMEGDVIWRLGVPTMSGKYDDDPNAYNPTSIAVAPNGDIYIADGYGRNWIHQFDPDLNYVRSFGGRGEAPGQFRTCHGIAIDTRGEEATLLVCDRENRRLQRFSLDGDFVEVVATDLRRPCSLSIWGPYTAVAELEGRVTVLDEDFKPAVYLGDNPDRSQWAKNGVPPSQWEEGVFTAPHGVCFDIKGDLYVMDWNATGRMTKLQRVGH